MQLARRCGFLLDYPGFFSVVASNRGAHYVHAGAANKNRKSCYGKVENMRFHFI